MSCAVGRTPTRADRRAGDTIAALGARRLAAVQFVNGAVSKTALSSDAVWVCGADVLG